MLSLGEKTTNVNIIAIIFDQRTSRIYIYTTNVNKQTRYIMVVIYSCI